MKVLISAYACEPDRGSEPGVGWEWARAAARSNQVWVLTRSNNLPAIRAWEERHGPTGITWCGHDGPRWRMQVKRRLPLGDHWYYAWWQRTVLPVAVALHQTVGFDLVHHVTFVSHQHPCLLARVGPPLILGPVAGADRIPVALRTGLGWVERVLERLRDFNLARNARRARLREAVRAATLVLAANQANADYCATAFGVAARVQPAMTVSLTPSSPIQRPAGGMRLIAAGRLLGWKGHWLTLRAFARLPADATLDIVGAGPDGPRLRQLAARLGVADRVTWSAWLPQTELHARFRTADVLMAPALRESGGMVVLEAIRCGCPVVAMALGGPLHAVQDGVNGRLVSTGDPDHVVAALAQAAIDAASLPRSTIAVTVDAFTPDRLAGILADIYVDVAQGKLP